MQTQLLHGSFVLDLVGMGAGSSSAASAGHAAARISAPHDLDPAWRNQHAAIIHAAPQAYRYGSIGPTRSIVLDLGNFL
eukprot:COSAG01_NODE_1028_length_12028_cov_5.688826_16_plen_79_part_00